ncbi:MAG: Tol-Pal system beta propeller repeat protein TolB [Bryobacter sp.]
MNRRNALLTLSSLAALPAAAQNSDIIGVITGGKMPTIALPELRGGGEAAAWMTLFNQTLFDEIFSSGVLKVSPRSFYPRQYPQQPQDFRQPPAGVSGGGLWLSDWAAEPVAAGWLATGYSVVQNGKLVFFGWLFDTSQNTVAGAQAFGKVYTGALDEAGTRKVAREFAAEILARFGAKSLLGSQIYFISNRSGSKELWVMDYDGKQQRQLTRYGSIVTTPTLSRDNSRIALTTFLRGNPGITILTADSARQLTFLNPTSSVVTTPEFTPDGKQILLSTKVGSGFPNIFVANADGSGLNRVTTARAVEVEPRINPKNSSEVVFISGRSGTGQLYKMNIDGTSVERLTDGTGQVANPCWHPDGKFVAFSWTRGFEPGNFNIFIMEIGSRKYWQLTHGAGRNQNPVWAPDGRHLAFGSRRGSSTQIWTMLADGTELKQLTDAGSNEMPVWSH